MKKRIFGIFLCLGLVLSMFPAVAATPTLMVAMKIGSPWCVIGNQVTQVDEKNANVVPIAESGRTLLPIRRVLEAFGGKVDWLAPNGVTCSLNGVEVALNVDEPTATVDGVPVPLDVPARAKNNRTVVPVRIVSESLGLTVAYDGAHQIVVVANGDVDKDNLAELPQVKTLIEKTTPKEEPTSHRSGSFTMASGTVSANIVTVNMADPRVSIKAVLPDGKLNNTRAFSTIAASSGAEAVINANFFNANDAVKDPVGHVMTDGQFLYASSGGTTLGITADNRMYYGRPAIFISLKTADNGTPQLWDAYEVNVLKQQANSAIIYTPARGAFFPVIHAGVVLTVENGVSTNYRAVTKGENVNIPANGFVAYFSTEETTTGWFQVPEMGRKLQIVPHLFTADAEGFALDGVTTIVGGGPRLVKDSAIVTEPEGQFAYSNSFKGTYAAPRTAIGTTADNKLLLVVVKSATIQQMRELMLHLGCVDAFNLDGGGSTAMYYQGQTLATPGRELTTTLQVFIKD